MAWYNPVDVVRSGTESVRNAAGSTIESARNAATSTIESARNRPWTTYGIPGLGLYEMSRTPFARGVYARMAGLSPAGLFLQPEQMGIKNAQNQSRYDQTQRINRIGTGIAAAVAGGYLAGPEVMAWISANPALAAKLGITAASLASGLGGKGGGASGSGGGAPGAQPSTGVVPRPRPAPTGSSYDRMNQYLGRSPGLGMPGGGGSPQMNPQQVQQLIAMLQSFLGTPRPAGGGPSPTGGYPRPYPGYAGGP